MNSALLIPSARRRSSSRVVAQSDDDDPIVAVGGGSTSDTCKGIAVMLAEGGEVTDYAIQFEPPDKVFIPDTPHDKIPIIAVPTTMGGAELSSGGGGFTSKALGRKLSLAGKGTTPKVIIIDGEALATTPMGILLSTAMGQFRIAVDSIYSRDHFPIADALALHTIKMLVDYLPRCSGGDIDCLLQAKTAAIMVMLARPGLGLNTATAHHVGGLYDVPHGEANAILLPHTMRFNLAGCGKLLFTVYPRLFWDKIGADHLWRCPNARMPGAPGPHVDLRGYGRAGAAGPSLADYQGAGG